MTEDDPITEESLEHFIILSLRYKEEGKTLQDLIEHLKNQLKIIKHKKFEKVESELAC